MDDIFGDMFDHIFHGRQSGGFQNSGFESGGFGKNGFYRQGFDSSQFVRKGQDLRAEVSITFEEAAFGCDKVIHLQSPDGRGSTQSLQVHIPAGIETGKSVRLRGKGMPGSNGGEAGDLLLKVKVGDKPGYERNGQDLYTKVNIPFTTAVFGGEVLVTTLYGNVMCKIRPGDAVRNEDPSSWKRNRIYEKHFRTWGSIRNSTDRGAEISESGSKTKVKRV